jgi:hypothetical protein
MLRPASLLRWLLPLIAIFAIGVSMIPAQDEESPEATQYREDYERYTKIMAGTDNVKKADELLTFLKEKPNSKMTQYVEDNYLLILDNLLKNKNFVALSALSKRLIDARPKIGETYYFLGVVYRQDIKRQEAMEAFAKCVAIKNKLSTRARTDLEALYKLENNGQTKGLDELIKKAEAAIGK